MPPARMDVVVLPAKRKSGRFGGADQEREIRKEWEQRRNQKLYMEVYTLLVNSYPLNEKQEFLRKYINNVTVDFKEVTLVLTFDFKSSLTTRRVYMYRNFYAAMDAKTRLLHELGQPKKEKVYQKFIEVMMKAKNLEEKEKGQG